MPRKAKQPDPPKAARDTGHKPGTTAFSPETPWLAIVNWRKAQKYKTANPPWIILYTSLRTHGHETASGKGWVTLSDASRSLLINLWLLAAEKTDDGLLWGDPAFLGRSMPLNSPMDVAELLEAEFVRYVDDAEAAELRAEAKKRKTKKAATSKCCAAKSRGEERRGEIEHTSASVRAPNQRALESIRVTGPKAKQSRGQAEPEPEAQPKPKGQAQAQHRPVEARRGPQAPKEPEGGGQAVLSPRRRTAAPRASLRGGSEPVRLGDCLAVHWADPAAVAFGRRIVQELWPGRDLDTDDAASEVGCFAKWYIEARARSPGLFDNGFVEHCAQKARHIAKYGKSARRRGAVLRSVLNKSMMSHGP